MNLKSDKKHVVSLILVFIILFTWVRLPENIVYGAVSYNGQTVVGNYTIENAAQLNLLAQKVNSGTSYAGSTFTLTANITYDSSITNNFIPIGNSTYSFSGIFDGNGCTVSGINIYYAPSPNYSVYNQGVFGYIKNAEIKNLGIINSKILANEYVGGIVGFAFYSTIDNCYTKMTNVKGSGSSYYRVGGLVGGASGTNIKNSYSESVVAAGTSGGITGYIDSGNITNCVNNSEIQNLMNCGGIAGIAYTTTFSNCINQGTFTGNVNGWTRAGIVSEAYGGCTIVDCKNYINIIGGVGIVSSLSGGSILRCENYGSILGSAGIVGYNDRGTVAYCANYGNINGLAGICGGSSRGRFYYCYNVGNITTNGYTAKDSEGDYYTSYGYPTGIVGYSNNVVDSITVQGCYSTGNLSGNLIKKYGLVGFGELGTNRINIQNSYYLDSIGAEAASIVEYYNGDYSSRERTSAYMKSQEFANLLNTTVYGEVENPYVITSKNNGYPILWYQLTVESITISGSATINKGDIGVYKAIILPENAPNKSLTWTVSNTDLAEVTEVGEGITVIVKGIKKGTITLTAKAQDGSGVTATKSITIGTNFVSSEANYILVDEAVDFVTAWKDTEKDSLYKEEYRYIHTPGTFKDGIKVDNQMGYVTYQNVWQNTAYTNFSKPGTYTIQYRVQDNPPTANKAGFENYRYYSDYVENTIYVHRKPVAVYSINSDTITDSSYDPDHSVSYSNKGITKWEWTCVSSSGVVNEYTATTKTSVINSVNAWINSYKAIGYKIILRVQDIEGAWSEPTIKGAAEYSKPVADFSIEKNPLTYPENQTITDLSYDTNGLALSYKWTVYKDNINIMTSTNSNLTSELNAKIKSLFPNVIGDYSISLQVINSAGVESSIVTKNFKVIVTNQAPIVDFELVSNESPVWNFPKILGLHTIRYRPTASFFYEEKTKFNVNVIDPNTDNTGFIYDWKLERFAVKNINNISGAAANTYSYTTQYPFANSFKGQGLPWGAYRITLSVTDKPPVPPYASGDAKMAIATKQYYIVPELSLTGSFESASTEIMIGDTITLKAKTSKETENVICILEGTTFTLNKDSEDSGFAYWGKNITIPDSITESGKYKLQFVGNTTYGGNGSITREFRDTVSLDIVALKLINFRITGIVNHPHISFPQTKDMLETELIPYKAGYYVTFRIDSKGKPDQVYGRVDIGNNGSVEQIIYLTKVVTGETETWQGRFYTSSTLSANTVISIKLDCNKGATVYDYNLKESWNGRSLITNGSALMDGRVNLTN